LILVFFLVNICSATAQVLPKDQSNTDSSSMKKTATKNKATVSSKTAVQLGTSILKIMSNADCWIYIDGESKGSIKAGTVLRVTLKKGQYQIKAVSASNNSDIITQNYTVETTGEELLYNLDLQSVTNKRLHSEADERQRQEATREEIARQKAAEESRIQMQKEQEEKARQVYIALYAEIDKNMVEVQGGTFTMGCTAEQRDECNLDQKPAHQVTLSSFMISKYDITQAQWQTIMDNNPSRNKGCEQCPVVDVNWHDVQAFITKLNEKTGKRYRLPTEAEWEHTARSGIHSMRYKYAGSEDYQEVGWLADYM